MNFLMKLVAFVPNYSIYDTFLHCTSFNLFSLCMYMCRKIITY